MTNAENALFAVPERPRHTAVPTARQDGGDVVAQSEGARAGVQHGTADKAVAQFGA